MSRGPGRNGLVDPDKEERPVFACPVERTRADQAFQNSFVHRAGIHASGKILQRFEGAFFIPFCEHHAAGSFTYAFDGGQPITNSPFAFTNRFRHELHAAGVDVRR